MATEAPAASGRGGRLWLGLAAALLVAHGLIELLRLIWVLDPARPGLVFIFTDCEQASYIQNVSSLSLTP